MRLTAGKCEYDLPLDFYKMNNVHIKASGFYGAVYDLPQRIPQETDMSHIERAGSYRRDRHPKESIPVCYTIWPPKRGRKKSTIVFLPAPSKNWKVEISYFTIRNM